MSSVIVYGTPLSTAVSRVLACLFEKDVDFKFVSIDMSKGQHKSPDFLKLQPFGQVPAFQDENTTLFESRAICRYICDKYDDHGNKSLFGKRDSILERASIDQWLEAESQSFNPPSSTLILQLALAPRMGLTQDLSLIEQSKAKLSKVLDVYEQRLEESRYLAGDEFTVADLSHLPNSEYLVNATNKGGLITERKNVGRWWKDISSRECWKKVVEMMEAAKAPPS